MESETFGSSEAAKKGGEARAKNLTSGEKKAIAALGGIAKADKARATPLPKASHEGILRIGDSEIACAVLEGGKRVITQSTFMTALGRARQAKGRQYYKGSDDLPSFLNAQNLQPFVPAELTKTSSQIEFRGLAGTRAFGYPAEILPDVCGVFLDAKAAGKLVKNQEHIAEKALLLIRGLAATGIVALVDEATGYQYDRPRRDLEEYLKKFLSEHLRRWVKTFPNDYFKHLCRLRGVPLRPDMKLPRYFGQLTNNLIYRRIAPGLLLKLKESRDERGAKHNKLHQWLSDDVGVREVLMHLGTVVALMKIHTDYAAFEEQLDRIAPKYPQEPGLFDNPDDWKSEPA